MPQKKSKKKDSTLEERAKKITDAFIKTLNQNVIDQHMKDQHKDQK
jgi:hypothetical protein